MSLSLFSEGMPELIAPALAAGLVVASTHVPLGREVLKRGIIFLDLAVAQIAAFGAVAATVIFGSEGGLGQQVVAFLAALAAAVIFSLLEKKGQKLQEAYIGCAFVLSASLSIIVFAGDPHGGEEISNLMAGQILWTSWTHVGVAALIYLPILAVLLALPKLAQKFFYLLFAASITISVQMVGVYLVFASLILPALASDAFEDRKGVLLGYLTSFLAVAGGLMVSALSDLPSGPVIVCSYAVAACIVRFITKLIQKKTAGDHPNARSFDYYNTCCNLRSAHHLPCQVSSSTKPKMVTKALKSQTSFKEVAAGTC